MGWWKIIKEWLQPELLSGQSSCVPVSHRPIVRTEAEGDGLHQWRQSDCRSKALTYISDNFSIWKEKPCNQCDGIDFIKLPSYQGFIIHFMDLDHECGEVSHLFDYLKDRVLALGYKVQVSDERVFEKSKWRERIERHHLKPRVLYKQEEKMEQKFGNINIELRYRDNEPMHLKFAAATYFDCQYKNAEEFGQLMEHIVS